MHQQTLIAALTASLSALPAVQAGFYTKNSPVLQVDARSYNRLIAQSNHTSIVEFYAPWCGHCQNLKPAYEKAAKNLDGLAKVAAVDCDEETNKQFCGSMGVQGFPTLKIVRPGKKSGKPVVEDYQGQRTASAIVEAVVSKISNHVKKLTDKDVGGFISGDVGKPKALLFTEKGTTSALLRSIAIDFLDVVQVGQIRNKEKATVEKFGITSFPTLVLIPGEGKDPIVYDGELNKKDMTEFLRQVGEPNPDPAPAGGKGDKKTNDKKTSSKSATKNKTTKEAKSETEAESKSTETAPTAAAAAAAPEASLIDITTIETKEQLEEHCLQSKSHTCVLALVPSTHSETKAKALHSMNQLNTKYIHGHRHAFPFFSISDDVESSASIRKALDLNNKVEIIVINARRAWWTRYDGDMSTHSVEGWLDAVRMGEGQKGKLPKDIIVEAASEESTETTQASEPAPETETETETSQESGHDEL